MLIDSFVFSTTINQSTIKIQCYQDWKAFYHKEYSPNEDNYRRAIFNKNNAKIIAHNSDPNKKYELGHNQLSALTDKEFKQIYLTGLLLNKKNKLDSQRNTLTNEQSPTIKQDLSSDIDWAIEGGVTSVKDQGSCGSCWAFSAIAVTESYYLIYEASYTDLSEQQLIDCTTSLGNFGCDGGYNNLALQYIKDQGVMTESSYPYVAKNQKCKINGGNYSISSIIQAGGCVGLQLALSVSPLSVTVDATNWQLYSSGVFDDCGNTINHAVQLVGIVGGDWKIKNSWGVNWGQSGFITLAGGDTCGICDYSGLWVF